MTGATLVLRSLRYYWRTHSGIVAGVAVATAVLTGALLLGDSVRFSLRRLGRLRLGDAGLAMATGEGLFRARLADEIGG